MASLRSQAQHMQHGNIASGTSQFVKLSLLVTMVPASFCTCSKIAAARNPWLTFLIAGQPNNSFKPTPLRSSQTVADKACHCLASTTRRGLTQVLGRGKSISSAGASADASRSTFVVSCRSTSAGDLRSASSCVGRAASDSTGAPPPSQPANLRVGAQVLSRLAVLAVALSLAGVRCFGQAARSLRLRKPRPARGSAFGQRLPCRAWSCCLRFTGFGRNVRPNNSSKPTPLRGAA